MLTIYMPDPLIISSTPSPTPTHPKIYIDYGPRGLFGDFKPLPDEPWYLYAKRLCSEGHSVPDALLTVAASQIGQVMLTSSISLVSE